MPALHVLEPERATLHGHFSRSLAPVLEIDPGDTVRFRTLDVHWGLESFAPLLEGRERETFPGRVSPQDDGHALVGPVAIRGARPGMALEVGIGAIVPGRFGACLAGGRASEVNERLGIAEDRVVHAYVLEPETMTGRNQHGHVVALRPFMGILGVAPRSTIASSLIAREHGLGRADALALASVAVDLRVTQIVNRVKGVHAVLPDGALQ